MIATRTCKTLPRAALSSVFKGRSCARPYATGAAGSRGGSPRSTGHAPRRTGCWASSRATAAGVRRSDLDDGQRRGGYHCANHLQTVVPFTSTAKVSGGRCIQIAASPPARPAESPRPNEFRIIKSAEEKPHLEHVRDRRNRPTATVCWPKLISWRSSGTSGQPGRRLGGRPDQAARSAGSSSGPPLQGCLGPALPVKTARTRRRGESQSRFRLPNRCVFRS